MPCVTVIGHSRRADRGRPTSLPAEARSACRWLRLLDNPELAVDALLDIIETCMISSETSSLLASSSCSSNEQPQRQYLDDTTQQHLINTLKKMGNYGWSHFNPGEAENRMALALQIALTHDGKFANTIRKKNRIATNTNNGGGIITANSIASSTRTMVVGNSATSKHVASKSIMNNTDGDQLNDHDESSLSNSDIEGPRPAPMTRILEKKSPGASKEGTTTVAVVSDASSAGEDNNEYETASATNTMDEDKQDETARTSSFVHLQSMKQCWAVLLESLQLEVASRTTRVWGRKKIYEIYQLRAPASSMEELKKQTTAATTTMNNSRSSSAFTYLANIRRSVEHEFRSVFHGGTEDQSGCRIYTKYNRDHDVLYLQFNIGKPFDYQDEQNRSRSGEKKKKKANEFVVLVKPESSLIALTASRAPSNSRFTPYVTTAVEAVLASTRNTSVSMTTPVTTTTITKKTLNASAVPKRFGDWTGTEPLELLQSAEKAHDGQAVGRFAKLAAEHENSTTSDPLLELHTMSTKSLIDRSKEDKRLETGKDNGRHVAQLQQQVEAKSARGGEGSGTQDISAAVALVATTKDGNRLLLDHSATNKAGRKRARDAELGRRGDCPRLQRVAWKWTGETSAAATCWLDDDDNRVCADGNNKIGSTTSIPNKENVVSKTKFKCGVVMEGTNVFEGLRAMVAAGLAKAPLPDFVRDAPTLGSGTITVDHDEFGGTDAFAAV